MIDASVARTSLPLILSAGLCITTLSAFVTAQDTDKVRDTVKRLEAVLSEVDTRLSQVTQAETAAGTLRADNESLRQQLTVAMTQLQQRGRDLELAQRELTATRADLDGQKQTIATLQEQKEQRRLHEDELAAKLARLEQRAMEDAKGHQQRLQETTRLAESRAAELDSLRAQLASTVEARKLDEQRQQDSAAEADALRARANANAAAIAQLEAKLAEQARLADGKARECDALRAQVETLRAQADRAIAASAAADKVAGQLTALTAQNQTLANELAAARDQLATASERGAAATKASEVALGQARARAEAATDEAEQLRAQLDALRAAPARVRDDGAPLQVHHHGSGNIILQIPARTTRTEPTEQPATEVSTDNRRRIDE